jgi:hypothetical protein
MLPEDVMRSSFLWLTLLLVLAGCREPRSQSARADAPEVGATPGGAESSRAEPGVEFEAPRLIPAIRAQMTEIQDPQGATEGNLTAFKNGVGALIDAMVADLNGLGVTDAGDFSALSDSIGRQIGGGSGTPAAISPDQGRQAAARVERLIRMYEERMRKAAR